MGDSLDKKNYQMSDLLNHLSKVESLTRIWSAKGSDGDEGFDRQWVWALPAATCYSFSLEL